MDSTSSLGTATRADRDVLPIAEWLQEHRVTVIGIGMVAAQVAWMAAFLSHSFFRQDDFAFYERALSSGLSWKYLMWVNGGHVTPVALAITWVLARIAPFSWPLASAATLLLLACADLALLRLLRTLFGNHPGILLALLVFLVSPLNFPGLSWWAVSSEVLPLEIGIFCALNAHVRYVWTGRLRYAVIAALWLLLGMASAVKGAGVPFLLLAVTSAWLMKGSWLAALLRTLRWHWRAWALYLVVVVGYAAVYVHEISQARQPTSIGALSRVLVFVRQLLVNTLVPGLIGGPWTWFTKAPYPTTSHGQYGIANPPNALVVVALLIATAVVLVAIVLRRRSWRSWAIALGWLILIDAIPALIGRGGSLPAALLGQETRYVMDGLGVLVVCAAFCFLPLAGPNSAGSAVVRPLVGRPPGSFVAMGLASVVVIGSLLSYHNYVADTSSGQARSYFATARAALRAAPGGAVVLNQEAPAYVTGGFYGPVAMDSRIFASLRRDGGAEPPFISMPAGSYDRLLMFNGWGQLVPAQVFGSNSIPLPGNQKCFPVARSGKITVRLGPAAPGVTVSALRFGYVGWAAARVTVSYAGRSHVVRFNRGLHSAFLPVAGAAPAVTFTGMGRNLCVGDVEVGALVPSALPPIPAAPLSG